MTIPFHWKLLSDIDTHVVGGANPCREPLTDHGNAAQRTAWDCEIFLHEYGASRLQRPHSAGKRDSSNAQAGSIFIQNSSQRLLGGSPGRWSKLLCRLAYLLVFHPIMTSPPEPPRNRRDEFCTNPCLRLFLARSEGRMPVCDNPRIGGFAIQLFAKTASSPWPTHRPRQKIQKRNPFFLIT